MSLKKNVIANFLGQGWTALMGIAFLPLYIKYLGIEAYGLIGVFALMQASLTLLDMGMTPTLNREMARYTAGAHTPKSIRELLRSLEIISFAMAILIGSLIWLASTWLASDWLQVEELPIETIVQAVTIMGGVIALRLVEGLYRGALVGLQKQVLFNIINSILGTLRAVGAIAVLIWVSPTIDAYFAWQGLVSLMSLAFLAIATYKYLPPSLQLAKFSLEAVVSVWGFAGSMMGITFLALLLTQIDKVLLSRFLPLHEFGYYTLATTVAGVLFIIIAPISQAVFPRLVELHTHESNADLIAIYHHSCQLVTILTTPIVLLLGCFAGGIIFMWSGNAELAENTAPVLTALALGSFLNGLMHIPYQLQLAHGWTNLAFKVNLVAVFVFIPAIFWIVPRYGATGTAWVWVALNTGYVLIGIQFMHYRLIPREKIRWYFSDVLLPLCGAGVFLLLATLFQPDDYLDRWKWFFFLSLAGSLALGGAILLSDTIRPEFKRHLYKFFKLTS